MLKHPGARALALSVALAIVMMAGALGSRVMAAESVTVRYLAHDQRE